MDLFDSFTLSPDQSISKVYPIANELDDSTLKISLKAVPNCFYSENSTPKGVIE